MGMGFAPTWLRQVSGEPPPLLHTTTLTTGSKEGKVHNKTYRRRKTLGLLGYKIQNRD